MASKAQEKAAGRTKRRSADKAAGKQPQPKVIDVPDVQSDDPEVIERTLSAMVPGWADLSKVQRKELQALIRRERETPEPVRVKLEQDENGKVKIDFAGTCEMLWALKLRKIFDAHSMDVVNARAAEIVRYLESIGACNSNRYNAVLAFVESMAPRDQAEAMLLVRHYVTHDAAIRALSQLGSADFVPQAQVFGNLAAKLMARADQQLETLAKLRRGGEQVVKHIHIDNRGGQAVVADQVNGVSPLTKRENEDQTYATAAVGVSPALLGSDPLGNGVPISGGEREAAMQDARRHQPGRAEG